MKKTIHAGHLLLAIAIIIATFWLVLYVSTRISDVEILKAEIESGLYCSWEEQPLDRCLINLDNDLFFEVFPWKKIRYCTIDYRMRQPRSLGRALSRLGNIHVLSIGQGDVVSLSLFLTGLGEVEDTKELFLLDVELDDQSCLLIGSFSNVEELGIAAPISGAEFPLLAMVSSINLYTSPISDVGLRNILEKCPSLEEIVISSSQMTRDAFGAFKMSLPNLRSVRLEVDFKLGEDTEFHLLEIREINPLLDFHIFEME